jgi:hypothetical protein
VVSFGTLAFSFIAHDAACAKYAARWAAISHAPGKSSASRFCWSDIYSRWRAKLVVFTGAAARLSEMLL